MNIDHWITAVLALRNAKNVVVFTGDGISAESGIPTFRDTDGFWQRFPPEQFASWRGLLPTALTNPHSVAEFVLNVVEPIANAHPNDAHHAVTELQRRVHTSIITQNVDGLHQNPRLIYSEGTQVVVLRDVIGQAGTCCIQSGQSE